jgi:sensor histidine kinase YesM
MEPEQLEALNQSLCRPEEEPSQHKGLRNIARRLYLQYGAQSGVRLRSQAGGGLQVIVTIAQPAEAFPAERERGEERPCTVSSL